MTATAPFSLAKLLSALSLSSSSSSSSPPAIQLQSHPDRRALHSLLSEKLPHHASVEAADTPSILSPALTNASILCFKSGYYNVQIVAEDNEPEERLVSRFRREVVKAGVLQECKRRRFFETKQEAKKRKTREAAKRYRKRCVMFFQRFMWIKLARSPCLSMGSHSPFSDTATIHITYEILATLIMPLLSVWLWCES